VIRYPGAAVQAPAPRLASSDDPACPICGAAGAPIDRLARGAQRWTCFACDRCACHYWSPRAVDPSFYAAGHQATYDRRRGGEVFLRERHHMFLRRARPGRLLDVGCGEGGFLEVARARGFEVAGIDLDAGNVAAARGRGLAVETALLVGDGGELPQALRDRAFDWVTAFDVLEHQAEPLAFLEAARRLLAPGGAVCGSVPNRDRLLVGRDRRHNDGDLPPHHFLWFSIASLRETLRRAGFRHASVSPIPERDRVAFAAYIEIALTGGITRRRRGRARGGPVAASGTSSARRSRRLASTVKNLPFLPLALAVDVAAPGKVRNLFFEART
jgi:SAM-dependent methyltransferase